MGKVKEHRLLERVGAQPEGGGFARALASTEFHTRERGLQALTTWLSRRKEVSDDELLRLWKALFFCFWHSDKAPVQLALAERLAEVPAALPPAVGDAYLRSFVRTMRREWARVDRLRLDKFMTLTRRVYAAHLRALAGRGWDAGEAARWAAFWRDEALLPRDTLVAAGFGYHVAELALPELLAACAGGAAAPRRAAAAALLAPAAAAAARARDGALLRRLRAGVFEPLAAEVAAPSAGDALRHLDAAAFAEELFQLGAAEGVRAANRELLYDASKAIEAAVAERAAAAAEAGGKSKQRPAAAAPAPAPAPTAAAKPAAAVKPAAAAAAAAAEPPAAKPKKRKASDAAAAKGNGHAPSPAPPAAAAAEPDQPSSKKKQKKARKAAAVAALAAAAAAAPDERTPEPEAAAAAGRPKSVRFSLRRNIVNTIGNAPVPADVRTPPSSRPKGSALKKAAPGDAGPTATRLARRLAAAAGAGPSKLGGRGVPSPYSVPRPRAAEFF